MIGEKGDRMLASVHRLLTGFALAWLIVAAPVLAQRVTPSGDGELLLRNGQWAWADGAQFARTAGSDAVSIVISLPGQIAYVYRDGVLIAASTVSTGKRGKGTPTGDFTILQKRVFHRSNLYSNAPMPFMQRLTWDGIALHAGDLPGYPASHGCIRFPREFARRLFELTQLGTSVSVVGHHIEDPRLLPGTTPPARPILASAPPPQPAVPFLRPDVAAFRAGEFDVVTASNDVIIPLVEAREVISDGSVLFAPRTPVVQPVSGGR